MQGLEEIEAHAEHLVQEIAQSRAALTTALTQRAQYTAIIDAGNVPEEGGGVRLGRRRTVKRKHKKSRKKKKSRKNKK